MLQAPTDRQPEADIEADRLHEQLYQLVAENAQLREENEAMRAALDAHIARASSTGLYGPLELSAGTCVGPRRGSRKPMKGGES
jgi:hypothetical protein